MFDHTVIEAVEGSTQIEIFRAPGVDTDPAVSEECFQIAHSLDLEKQAAAYKTDTSTLVWPIATKAEIAVYATCFPESIKLEDYSSPLPLSVLREIEKAKAISIDDLTFWEFRVLCPKSGDLPDPVLIGYFGPKGQNWKSKPYIIARWGSSLLPFATLATEARTRLITSVNRVIADARRDIEVLSSADPSSWKIDLPTWGDTTLARYESLIR